MEYDRLTGKSECGYNNLDACLNCDLEMDCGLCPYWAKALDRLAELEAKIEQGTLIELPCKVGDTVYQTDGVRIYESKVELLIYDCGRWAFNEKAIGTSVFLTREEAEKRLKELKE